jgi:hypothetical protein
MSLESQRLDPIAHGPDLLFSRMGLHHYKHSNSPEILGPKARRYDGCISGCS